jgi:hypothetical protein
MPLFPENVELMLESPAGPVGQFIRLKAEEVLLLTRLDVREIMYRLPDDKLEELVSEVQIEMEGTTAKIGIVNTGREIAEYLADKAVREQDRKLTKASLAKVFVG